MTRPTEQQLDRLVETVRTGRVPKMSQTPGPWKVIEGKDDLARVYAETDHKGFCVASVNTNEDARLIAAAPELLAALREASNACNVCAAQDAANADYWFKKQRIVDAAIARAEGRL